MTEIPTDIHNAVTDVCQAFGIDIEPSTEITVTDTVENEHVVAVPLASPVLLDDLLDQHGRYLGTSNNIEVNVYGYDENGNLLLTAIQPNQSQ